MIRELNEKLFEFHNKFPLYGIILFTEEHPYIIKALKDKTLYSAIDQLSGEHMVIFTSMLFSGDYTYPTPPSGMLAKVAPIWKEPKANIDILTWFDIKDSRSLPVFALFCDIDDKLHYYCYPLKEKSAQDVFNSLRGVITVITQQVKNKEKSNKIKLFKKVQWQMKKHSTIQKAKDILAMIRVFRGTAGL